MIFPEDFLTDFAKQRANPKLSDRESQIFQMLFGQGETRVQIQQVINVSASALSTALSGVYRKFRINGSGPVKESRLKDVLAKEFQKGLAKDIAVEPSSESEKIDDQQIRQHCRDKILRGYSEIQLYNGYRLNLANLYVPVYLQEQRSSQREAPDLEMPLELAADLLNRHSHVFIEGDSGRGKSTLIYHLAVQCGQGKWQPDLIPILLELGRVEEVEGIQFSLSLELSDILNRDVETINRLLKSGKILLLLDGLDEVSLKLRKRIIKEVGNCLDSRILITCRSAIRDYLAPREFKYFEVSAFTSDSQECFIENWFLAAQDPKNCLYQLARRLDVCNAENLRKKI
jgi:predicted NACHT family NTPase